MSAQITIREFIGECDGLECSACHGSGEQRDEDDAGSYGVKCDGCNGHGAHVECSSCDELATRRVRATVDDGLYFDQLACPDVACIGSAIVTSEARVADYLERKAKRDAQVAADVARNSCGACDSPIVCCSCAKTVRP